MRRGRHSKPETPADIKARALVAIAEQCRRDVENYMTGRVISGRLADGAGYRVTISNYTVGKVTPEVIWKDSDV